MQVGELGQCGRQAGRQHPPAPQPCTPVTPQLHPSLFPQSLQIAAFLFTVCHVVIVVQDWFTDLSLYR